MNINEFLQKFNRSITEIVIIKKEDALKAVVVCLKAVESDGYALRYVDISIFKEEKT